jgi:hypothetical protein
MLLFVLHLEFLLKQGERERERERERISKYLRKNAEGSRWDFHIKGRTVNSDYVLKNVVFLLSVNQELG